MYLNSYTSLYVICSLHICNDTCLVRIFVVCSWHFWSEYGPSAPCMSDKNVRHVSHLLYICMSDQYVRHMLPACVHAWSKRVICSLHICLSPQNVCHLLFACEHFNVRDLLRVCMPVWSEIHHLLPAFMLVL
jgi:hypothetical protein